MANIKLIEQLSNAFGVSGFEDEVVSIIKKHCNDMECKSDGMNNLLVKPKNYSGKKPVVLIDAHTDEVGFMVEKVKENGLICFVELGGWVKTNLPAHTVKIRNQKGELIKGVIGSKPPHFMENKDASDIGELTIDVGATSYEEVTDIFGINVGDPIVPDVNFEYIEKTKVLMGKGLDDRVGCYCIIEILNKLAKEQNLNVDIVGSFSSQEEVGARGAVVTAQLAKPDLAIIIEAPPADDIYLNKHESQGALKGGAQFRHYDACCISNPKFISFGRQVAKDNNIKLQESVRKKGGTNASVIHIEGRAVPSLVIGVPTRYIHTHYTYCAEEDIDSAVEIATAIIKSLDSNVLGILRGDV